MLVIALLSSLLISTVLACSHNFEPWYNGMCFRKGYGTTQYDSNVEFCSHTESHLPRIMNKAENDFFLQQILCTKPEPSVPCSGSWLDLQCDANKNFVWGDLTPVTYTNFRGAVACDPAVRYAINSTDGFWFAVDGKEFLVGVCQQASPLSNDKCRGYHPAAEPLGRNGDCYSVQFKNTWDVAEENCLKDGGHLSSIHSAKENTVIFNAASSISTAIHIGLSTETCGTSTANTKYKWTDGSDAAYTNFDSSARCNDRSKCVAMIVRPFNPESDDSAGRWDSVQCDHGIAQYPSVCVRPAISLEPIQPAGCPPVDRFYNIGDYIVSPGFPSAGAAAHCTYTVNVPAGKSVRLRPVSFEANRCCDSLLIHNQARNIETWTGIHAAPSAVFSTPVGLEWTAKSGAGVVGFRILVEEVTAGSATPKPPPSGSSTTDSAPPSSSSSSIESSTKSSQFTQFKPIFLAMFSAYLLI